MRAGLLRHRVTLQRATESQDAFGQPSETWAALDTVWARVEPLTAREFIQAQQSQQRITHRVTIRYYSGLTGKDRVKFGTRILNIVGPVNTDERGIEMVLMCEEVL